MTIDILVNEVTGGWEPDDTRLGGTEESVVEWAKCLADRGHKVDVYHNKRSHGYAGGFYPYLGKKYKENDGWAFFQRREDYFLEGRKEPDVTISIKSSDIKPSGKTVYFTNETNASNLDLSKYDCVVWPSDWAKDNIPVNNEKVYVVPHGYNSKKIYPAKKVLKQCFYASSPDRGLDVLLEAWPKVYASHPDATLILTYGGESDLPGVINLGECDEETMNEVYRTSDIWCHPCTGVELYCITGQKAQAAGCWPVIIPAMALKETVHYGTISTEKNYAKNLINALNHHPEKHYDGPTWKTSTDKLLEIIQKVVH